MISDEIDWSAALAPLGRARCTQEWTQGVTRPLHLLPLDLEVVLLLERAGVEVVEVPVGVGGGDADAETKGKVKEEALAQHASNGSDGHCGRVYVRSRRQ